MYIAAIAGGLSIANTLFGGSDSGGVSQQASIDAQNQQNAISADQWNYYKTNYQPLETNLIDQAKAAGSPEEFARARGAANADVTGAFDRTGKEFEAGLQARGINPGSPAYTSGLGSMKIAEGATRAGALTAADNATRALAYSKGLDVVGLGRNIPAQSAASSSAAATNARAMQNQQFLQNQTNQKNVGYGLDALGRQAKTWFGGGTPDASTTYNPNGTTSGSAPVAWNGEYADGGKVGAYGKRADGTDKGTGFLGPMKRPDGRTSTEISIGVPINGQQMEIPTMVPTLSQQEIQYLLNNDERAVLQDHPIANSIRQKAIDHAQYRVDAEMNPFAGPEDVPLIGGRDTVPDIRDELQKYNERQNRPQLPITLQKYDESHGLPIGDVLQKYDERQALPRFGFANGGVIETKQTAPGRYEANGLESLLQKRGLNPTMAKRHSITPHMKHFAAGGSVGLEPQASDSGMISGPGTATSDSIPAQIDGQAPASLSNGEYVMPASAVDMTGEEIFDAIRQASLQKRAQGLEPQQPATSNDVPLNAGHQAYRNGGRVNHGLGC